MEGSQCLICLEPCTKSSCVATSTNVPVMLKGEGTPLASSQAPVERERQDLNVMFLLRQLLQVPKELCTEFLMKHGGPAEWGIFICTSCSNNYMDRAITLQEQSIQIAKMSRIINSQMMEHVLTSSVIAENVPAEAAPTKGRGRGKRKNKSGPGPVFQRIREWAVQQGQSVQNANGANSLEGIIAAVGGVDKFVAQQKAEKAFRALGPGRKLTADSQAVGGGGGPIPSTSAACGYSFNSTNVTTNPNPNPTGSASHAQLQLPVNHGSSNSNRPSPTALPKSPLANSEEKRAANAAAQAALARIQLQRSKRPDADSKEILAARQAAFIKEQARKQLEEENDSKGKTLKIQSGLCHNNNKVEIPMPMTKPRVADHSAYAVKGVFYRCPDICDNGSGRQLQLFSRKEVETKIREFLLTRLHDDGITTSCQLIKSCNAYPEMVSDCVETLCRYLDNIIKNPTQTKYRQIRIANRIFREKIVPILGAQEFLQAIGFEKAYLESGGFDNAEEEHWVYEPDEDSPFIKELIEIRDELRATEAVRPILDRNVQVLKPQEVAARSEFPDEFFNLSVEEIRREQELKLEKADQELTLRTKAMRERDELRQQAIYRYAVMRIRFPDSLVLQGTFGAHEKISKIFEFVRENLITSELDFQLIQSGGENLSLVDENTSLAARKLPPSTVFNFQVVNPPEAKGSGEISYLDPQLVIAAL